MLAIPVTCLSQQEPASFVMPSTSTVYPNRTIEYYRYLPIDYATSNKKFPVIIFLHGAGEVKEVNGSIQPLSVLLKNGMPPYILQYENPKMLGDFVVISPHSPRSYWYPEFVNDIFDHIFRTYENIDTNRVYLTGLSAGGRGTWMYMLRYSERVTAIVPISSPGSVENICPNPKVPVWGFMGESDFQTELGWAAAYNSCTPPWPATVTEISGAGHNSQTWETVYKNLPISPADGKSTGLTADTIYKWMLKFSKQQLVQNDPIVVNAGSDQEYKDSLKITLRGQLSGTNGRSFILNWTQVSGPVQTHILEKNSLSTEVAGLVPGEYIFRLEVKDENNQSYFDEVIIIITASANGAGDILYRVNCGGDLLLDTPLNWIQDLQTYPAQYLNLERSTYTTGSANWKGINNTDAPNNIFGNYRYSRFAENPISYAFPVPEGYYTLKLYFADPSILPGDRMFDVAVEGEIVIKDFDIAEQFGSQPGLKTVNIFVHDGELNVNFFMVKDFPRIDGIEIVKSEEEESIITEIIENLNYNVQNKTIRIQLNESHGEEVTAELFDVHGRSYGVIFNGPVGDRELVVKNVNRLPSGVYLLVAKSKKSVSSGKLIIY